MMSRITFAAVLQIAFCLAITSPSSAQEAISTDDIRAAYTEQLQVFESIVIEYRHLLTATAEMRNRLANGIKADQAEQQHRVVIQDGMWIHELKASPTLFGSVVRGMESFDGTNQYHLSFDAVDPTSVKSITIDHAPAAEAVDLKAIDHLLARATGVSIVGCPDSLATLLARFEMTSPELDRVSGHDCWRVRFSDLEFADGTEGEVEAWFDATSGFMPRQVVSNLQRPTRKSDATKTAVEGSVEVVDFAPIQTAGGPPRWLPREVELKGSLGRSRILVDSTSIAAGLNPAEFTPELADGTLIIERLAGGTERRYIIGEQTSTSPQQPTIQEFAAQVRDAAMSPPVQQHHDPIDARGPPSPRWPLFVAGLAALALITGVWMWRRG